ncbi:PTS sugar transporter subunit IIC [Companilactobacillus kimchiensis]|uniref:Permease IIC component n=1 Tax=Companilactobacillus kimchiensis TaxID=993692 RepID=A0A0R2LN89_9LACO|nr:PTS transporter subunit EIIC [Companilactobacillus kimchiensis]KRO00163.1 cellobiose-specific phosphotransferasesystem, enzyme IIC [Companilactobacillus kimchiensis]
MQKKIEEVLTPIADRLANNVVLRSLRDGFLIITPLIIIISIFLLIGNFPIPGWTNFWISVFGHKWIEWFSAVSSSVFSFMGLLSCFGISYAYGKNRGLVAIHATAVAIVAFLILTPTTMNVGHETIGAVRTIYLGPNGIFLGLFTALISVELFHFATKQNWTIKMPKGVPEMVSESFDVLLPSGFVILIFFLIRVIFSLTSVGTAYNFIYTMLQTPLKNVGNSLGSVLLYIFLASILWCFGINGPAVVNSVWSPILFVLTQDNLKAFQNGQVLPHIYTEQFIEDFSTYGGGGSILSLLIVMLFVCKSRRIKELGKITIIPSIFGIGEPLIYGLPVVLNPIIAIPFVITPVVNVLISGMAFTTHLVPYTNGVTLPWTTPPLISGWLTTGSWRGSALQLVEIVLGIFIYYPFAKILDRQFLKDELDKNITE